MIQRIKAYLRRVFYKGKVIRAVNKWIAWNLRWGVLRAHFRSMLESGTEHIDERQEYHGELTEAACALDDAEDTLIRLSWSSNAVVCRVHGNINPYDKRSLHGRDVEMI